MLGHRSLYHQDASGIHDRNGHGPVVFGRLGECGGGNFLSGGPLLLRILFKLRQCVVHFVPRVRVTCPHVHLWFEPARIIQTRASDRDKLRNGIGLDHNRRAAFGAKASASHATLFAGRRMKAGRALQELERLRRHDDERRKRPATRSLAIATVTVKHQNRFGCGFVADRAASASTGEGSCCAHVFVSVVRL